eukprot:m.15276 g.15276  ORF g.15276 m.15276 type:complete len:68 (-) comp10439_c0_seq1:8358-8561(-)
MQSAISAFNLSRVTDSLDGYQFACTYMAGIHLDNCAWRDADGPNLPSEREKWHLYKVIAGARAYVVT